MPGLIFKRVFSMLSILLGGGPDLTYLETVGNTPLVRLDRIIPSAVKANGARILAKMEMQNPGGSVKDRIALAMVKAAIADGTLASNGTIVEYTSGNTGIGLAMVGAAMGIKVVVVMPAKAINRERVMICRMYGAEVHLTDPAKGLKGLEAHAEMLAEANPGHVLTRQFLNPSNPKVHIESTGPEIWRAAGRQGVDFFVAGVGTGGTAAGVGTYLKRKRKSVKVIAVEPSESRSHLGAESGGHSITGIGAGVYTHFIPRVAQGRNESDPYEPRGVIDEFSHASSAEATEYAKKAAALEGMMVGPSSGAALKVAIDVASRAEAAGKTVVVLLASNAIRYSVHPMWDELRGEADAAFKRAAATEGLLKTVLKW